MWTPCYSFYNHNNICIHVLICVEDIVVIINSSHAISLIISTLSNEFAVKDLGPLSFFLGIQVTRTTDGLHLHQGKYVTDLLHRTKMVGAKPLSTPCSFGGKLSKFSGGPLSDSTKYRSVVGALQNLTLTRPDIFYSVNQFCQFLHCPTTVHLTATKHILRYL